ncbi:MAG: energy transducer TonB [Verrucomicrobiota bacterium]|nr:energy transducer TonB [Verrucomicrobiota bacterium]
MKTTLTFIVALVCLTSAFAKGKEPSVEQVRTYLVSAPRPGYPQEAINRKITGSGVIVCDVKDGRVISVRMAQSTGSPILDRSALSAFKRWRFMANKTFRFRSPITFTMNGASY